MAIIDNADEIEKIRGYVNELEAELAKLGIFTRVFHRYPFDTICWAIISKTFSLSRACLTLLESGFAEEAYGLSRSIVESALTLRFLTQDRDKLFERTDRYMRFTISDKQYWMYYALQNSPSPAMEEKIRDHAKQYDLKDDPSGVRKHWSGKDGFAWKVNLDDHPLDGSTTTELTKKSAYAVEYHATSSFVHCYITAVNNFLPRQCVPFEVMQSSGLVEKPGQKTLFTLLSHLHSTVAYGIFGLNLERPAVFNHLFSNALASLAPYRRIHS